LRISAMSRSVCSIEAERGWHSGFVPPFPRGDRCGIREPAVDYAQLGKKDAVLQVL
jgi:hypothetical protein